MSTKGCRNARAAAPCFETDEIGKILRLIENDSSERENRGISAEECADNNIGIIKKSS
jgi:hypothetical protein